MGRRGKKKKKEGLDQDKIQVCTHAGGDYLTENRYCYVHRFLFCTDYFSQVHRLILALELHVFKSTSSLCSDGTCFLAYATR